MSVSFIIYSLFCLAHFIMFLEISVVTKGCRSSLSDGNTTGQTGPPRKMKFLCLQRTLARAHKTPQSASKKNPQATVCVACGPHCLMEYGFVCGDGPLFAEYIVEKRGRCQNQKSPQSLSDCGLHRPVQQHNSVLLRSPLLC